MVGNRFGYVSEYFLWLKGVGFFVVLSLVQILDGMIKGEYCKLNVINEFWFSIMLEEIIFFE